jgi:dihydroxyacetone kinase
VRTWFQAFAFKCNLHCYIEGYKVDMVVVADDCALPPPLGVAGRRGLAGTLFVHKCAG